MKRIVKGLKNSQKIRVIVNGVGFHTTVGGVSEMVFTEQRVAVMIALDRIVADKSVGFASRQTFYDNASKETTVDFQVNLV
jgi:hypothetical protein